MMNNSAESFQTLFEIYREQGSHFPFWAKPWKVTHSIILVKGWVAPNYGQENGSQIIFEKIHNENIGYFLADRYTLDKNELLGKKLIVSAPKVRCWLPA
jgi:hypothetical protein